jgi:hypothetical protein
MTRRLHSSPHTKRADRSQELQNFFDTEVYQSEEANPSQEGKIRLTTSLKTIYEHRYKKYCEENGIKPMQVNKFYEVRKQVCKDVQSSKEYKKSKLLLQHSF